MKFLEYAAQLDFSERPTVLMTAVTVRTNAIKLPAYVERIADRYAEQDGLSKEAYLAKLILKDQYERRELATL